MASHFRSVSLCYRRKGFIMIDIKYCSQKGLCDTNMAKKKHRGHYCKICGEYKSNESFSGTMSLRNISILFLYGNNEERENKTFKKLCREQKMVLKAIVQDEVTFYWQAHRQIPVNDKLKQLRSSVNTVVYEHLDFAIKDDTMFKAYIQEQVIAVINKILRQEKEQNSQ